MRITFDDALNHLYFLAKLFGRNNARYVIVILLLELNVPTNYDGFDYLVKGIMIYFRNQSHMMSKGLYPAIAEECAIDVEPIQIESAIRSAIKAAWKSRDETAWLWYFAGSAEKPSNAEFISRIARILELWEGCCKEYERCKEEGMLRHER